MEKTKQPVIVSGLGLGDEGKGTLIDFLVRRLGVKTVVRYGGGPQAAHHVVEPSGRWHCFAQFGSGTFVPGVKTVLSHFMLVEPENLLREAEALKAKGIPDALERLNIHPDCVIVTPLQRLLNRMREVSRGNKRHGSVGLGVGETVQDAENFPDRVIRMRDLIQADKLREKLNFLWAHKLDQAEQVFVEAKETRHIWAGHDMLEEFQSSMSRERLIENYLELGELLRHQIAAPALDCQAGLIFEGAQGALLDRQSGFWPHVTKTSTTFAQAEELLSEAGAPGEAKRINVLRAYAHRHGAGPLVTEDKHLTKTLAESHNANGNWQGPFRVGWFDLLATRYAAEINGRQGTIALTNLDRLSEFPVIRAYTSYEYVGPERAKLVGFFEGEALAKRRFRVRRIIYRADADQNHQTKLTQLLKQCRPLDCVEFPGWQSDISWARKAANLPRQARKYLEFLGEGIGMPIEIVSVGTTWKHKLLM